MVLKILFPPHKKEHIMTDLKKELIKLGHTNPELRGNLKPILNAITAAVLDKKRMSNILKRVEKDLERIGYHTIMGRDSVRVHMYEGQGPKYIDLTLTAQEDRGGAILTGVMVDDKRRKFHNLFWENYFADIDRDDYIVKDIVNYIKKSGL